MVFARFVRKFDRVPAPARPSAERSGRRPERWLALEVLEGRVLPSFAAPMSYDVGQLPSSPVWERDKEMRSQS